MADHRTLRRGQVLRWRENWSESDRNLISQHLDRLSVGAFYEPQSQAYVGCKQANDPNVVMYVNPGYLEFRKDYVASRIGRRRHLDRTVHVRGSRRRDPNA